MLICWHAGTVLATGECKMLVIEGCTVTRYDSQMRVVWAHTFHSAANAQRLYDFKVAQVR